MYHYYFGDMNTATSPRPPQTVVVKSSPPPRSMTLHSPTMDTSNNSSPSPHHHLPASIPPTSSISTSLTALTTITHSLAHAYFLTGRLYHSLPDPIPGLRPTFTISPTRELPELITLFGILEETLLRARAAMLGGDEQAMLSIMLVANDLVLEAWWKVWWLDRMVANPPVGWEGEEMDEGEYERWVGALPKCCGAMVAEPKEEQQDEGGPVWEWLDGVVGC